MAACHPMDTAEIIAEAQSKASINPVIVRPQKRKSEAPKKVEQIVEINAQNDTSDDENEGEAKEERPAAPPPIEIIIYLFP